MPIIGGVGVGAATREKQRTLDEIAGAIIGPCVAAAKNWNQPCYILDGNAGCGVYEGIDGSPLILARHAQVVTARLRYPVTFLCAERNRERREQLRAVMAERFPSLAVQYFEDHRDAAEAIPRNAIGLADFDPNGYSNERNGLDESFLATFGQSHKRMDVLITREGTAFARMRGAAHTRDKAIMPQDYLANTGKTYSYIREYGFSRWWVFLFGSNYPQRKMGSLHMDEYAPQLTPAARRTLAKWTPGLETEPIAQQGELPWGA